MTENIPFAFLYVLSIFLKHPRTANSAVRGQIWPKFNLIRDMMVVIVNCKNGKDPIKKGLVLTRFSQL